MDKKTIMENKPEAEPEQCETPLQDRLKERPTERHKPIPDGEAIAEVGDALGGPA